MTKPSSTGRLRFLLSLSLLLIFVSLILALFLIPSSPVSALIFATLTPTQENLWAFVSLPKATYTPTPLYTPTAPPTMTPMATETPGVMAMEFIADTPVPVLPTKAPASQAQSVPVYGGSKYILVDISEQHMYVYEGDTLIYSFVASTGMNNATRAGTFAVQSKIPNAYGSTWDIWMPSWLGIYWSGGLENGIHALPILSNGATLWAGFLGRPVSYGCVVLGSYEAQLLYDWAEIGTPVEIRW
jgi:lipoprotein-anchoring transpeptidase ErfK/SrfK